MASETVLTFPFIRIREQWSDKRDHGHYFCKTALNLYLVWGVVDDRDEMSLLYRQLGDR